MRRGEVFGCETDHQHRKQDASRERSLSMHLRMPSDDHGTGGSAKPHAKPASSRSRVTFPLCVARPGAYGGQGMATGQSLRASRTFNRG